MRRTIGNHEIEKARKIMFVEIRHHALEHVAEGQGNA